MISLSCLAQFFNSASIIGGQNNQQCYKSITDKVGNVYVAIKYDSTFVFDSLGAPITIPAENGNNISLVKLDSNLVYQWHIFIKTFGIYKIEGFSNSTGLHTLDLDIDNQNNIFFTTNITASDSAIFLSSDNSIAKTYRFTDYPRSHAEATFFTRILPNGKINWVTFINKQDSLPSLYGTGGLRSPKIKTDISGNLLFSSNYTTYTDTLVITDALSNRTSIVASKKNQSFIGMFNPSGQYVSLNQAITKQNLLPETNYGIETDSLNNRYYLFYYNPTMPDTIGSSTFLPNSPTYIVYKTDSSSNHIWSKIITIGNAFYPTLSISPDGKRIYYTQTFNFGSLYSESTFYANNPYSSSGGNDILLGCLSDNGNTLWNQTFGGTGHDRVSAITENKDRTIYCTGTTMSSSLSFGNSTAQSASGLNALFITTFDSAFVNINTQSIQGSIPNMQEPLGIGRINFAQTGKGYLSGWFSNNIQFPCSTFTSQGGNDAFIAVLIPQPNPIDTGVCKMMQSPSGKYLWDSTATYFDTIPNSTNCDSVLIFNVTILQSKSTIDSSVCKSLTSPSGKYLWDSSGTYRDTIPNAKGCDSIMTIKLTVMQTKSTIDSSVCKSLTSPSGKYHWDSNGTYLDTIPNSKGCDSIITFIVTILQTKSTLDTIHCGTYISPSGKYVYDSTGIYTDTILNAKSCDSIITIRYTKLYLTKRIDTLTCAAITSPSGNYVYDSTGIYTDTIPSLNGCDSIITTHYTKATTQSSMVKYSCDSFVSPSGKHTYTTSGNYTDTIPSIFNCDSIILTCCAIKRTKHV